MKNLILSTVLLASATAGASVCNIAKLSNGYFYTTINGKTMTGGFAQIEDAYESMEELYRYRQCDIIANDSHLNCTVKRFSNGYFYALRGDQHYFGGYSDELDAAKSVHKMASLGLCRVKRSHHKCEIKKYSNGYLYVTADNQSLAGGYSQFKDAFERSYKLDQAGLCVSQRPRGDVSPRPPRGGGDRDYDRGDRRYDNFKTIVLDMSEDIIRIIEDLEPVANSDERVNILVPIKKQAARLSARIQGGAEFKIVKNTMVHLETLLDGSAGYIDENLERDGVFHDAKRLLTYKETVRTLVSLMRERGSNDDRVLY